MDHTVIMSKCEENAVKHVPWPGALYTFSEISEGIPSILFFIKKVSCDKKEKSQMEKIYYGAANLSGVTENDKHYSEALKYIP